MLAATILTDGIVQIIGVLVGAGAIMVVGWWQFGRTTRTVEKTAETIGEIDHSDESSDLTLVEMAREILAGQAHQDGRIASLEGKAAKHHDRLTRHAERLDRHGHRLDIHSNRLDALEKLQRIRDGEA